MVIGLWSKPYEEIIESLNLFDFRYCRSRGDLILTYNNLNTPTHPLKAIVEPRSRCVTRQHRFSLTVLQSRANCRCYFYSVRVIFVWNNLSHSVVSCKTLTSFKFSLRVYMQANIIEEPLHLQRSTITLYQALFALLYVVDYTVIRWLCKETNALLTVQTLNCLE